MQLCDLKPRLDEPEVQRVYSLSMYKPLEDGRLQRKLERLRSDENRQLRGISDGDALLATVEYYVRGDGVVVIQEFAVDEPYRLRGIGRAILLALRTELDLPLELETDDDAVGFYRKCGLEVTQIEDKGGYHRYRCCLK